MAAPPAVAALIASAPEIPYVVNSMISSTMSP
jgi:hypothetical protein